MTFNKSSKLRGAIRSSKTWLAKSKNSLGQEGVLSGSSHLARQCTGFVPGICSKYALFRWKSRFKLFLAIFGDLYLKADWRVAQNKSRDDQPLITALARIS